MFDFIKSFIKRFFIKEPKGFTGYPNYRWID